MATTLVSHLVNKFLLSDPPTDPVVLAIMQRFELFAQQYVDDLQSVMTQMEVPGTGLRLDDGNEPVTVQIRTKARDSVQGTMNEGAHQAVLGRSMSGKQVIQAFGVEDPLAPGG
jgi:hypothetical protein